MHWSVRVCEEETAAWGAFFVIPKHSSHFHINNVLIYYGGMSFEKEFYLLF